MTSISPRGFVIQRPNVNTPWPFAISILPDGVLQLKSKRNGRDDEEMTAAQSKLFNDLFRTQTGTMAILDPATSPIKMSNVEGPAEAIASVIRSKKILRFTFCRRRDWITDTVVRLLGGTQKQPPLSSVPEDEEEVVVDRAVEANVPTTPPRSPKRSSSTKGADMPETAMAVEKTDNVLHLVRIALRRGDVQKALICHAPGTPASLLMLDIGLLPEAISRKIKRYSHAQDDDDDDEGSADITVRVLRFLDEGESSLAGGTASLPQWVISDPSKPCHLEVLVIVPSRRGNKVR